MGLLQTFHGGIQAQHIRQGRGPNIAKRVASNATVRCIK